ncbi:MAG TPA: CHASE3 domain-containing protein [Steroidobacteraceae bacterium]|nr:CHASE3 domain-containing protein [Steroidobacteraceae bacterium]
MKIFGEELGHVGRWYVVLPPLLLIGFLVGLFFIAAAGQTRLNAADERVHNSEEREQALDDFLALIAEAESEQRGYLLTGESSYLKSYRAAAAKLAPALDRLHESYAQGPEPLKEISRLRMLSERKLGELDETLALYEKAGLDPAMSGTRTDIGKRTTNRILASVAVLRKEESTELTAATASWQSDVRMSRWITLGGAILNIGLVVLATGLVYGDMRRRARQATDLREQKSELARQVEERTRELTALSTHLQVVSELEKSALSRELHDELGGLLVAARMDLSWLQHRLSTSDSAIEQRFKRIHECLSAGVDLKRRVVEELRPTLLDNMGLFAALRWQFKESCRRAGLCCSESIPEVELRCTADAAIGVFRVAQEALTNILKHAEAKSADIAIEVQHDVFVMRISDDGKGIIPARRPKGPSHGLASMRHRVAALGGSWELSAPPKGGTTVVARIPLSSMLMEDPAAALASRSA